LVSIRYFCAAKPKTEYPVCGELRPVQTWRERREEEWKKSEKVGLLVLRLNAKNQAMEAKHGGELLICVLSTRPIRDRDKRER
jgi:hypothetical protein